MRNNTSLQLLSFAQQQALLKDQQLHSMPVKQNFPHRGYRIKSRIGTMYVTGIHLIRTPAWVVLDKHALCMHCPSAQSTTLYLRKSRSVFGLHRRTTTENLRISETV